MTLGRPPAPLLADLGIISTGLRTVHVSTLGPVRYPARSSAGTLTSPGVGGHSRGDSLGDHPPSRRLVQRSCAWPVKIRTGDIAGELNGLGCDVSASTVWAILQCAGIDPCPRRLGPTRPNSYGSSHGNSGLRFLPEDALSTETIDSYGKINHPRSEGIFLNPSPNRAAGRTRHRSDRSRRAERPA